MSRCNHQDQQRPLAYLAGPLFSEAERAFNGCLAARLEAFVNVYLPQRDGGLMSELVAVGMQPDLAARRVFQLDTKAIQAAEFVIAILDGRTVDEGVAFELGLAFSQSKRCVGLQTDSRRLAAWGNNPMITGALEIIFDSVDDLENWLEASVFIHKSELGSPLYRSYPPA